MKAHINIVQNLDLAIFFADSPRNFNNLIINLKFYFYNLKTKRKRFLDFL